MYRVEAVALVKSDGGRPSRGYFYDVCAGSFEKCMEFIRSNAVATPGCPPTFYRIVAIPGGGA